MLQKIIQVGNSYAITIPKKFLDALKFPEDGLVKIHQDQKKGKIVVDFMQEEAVEQVVDKEVYKVAKQLLKRYLPAFKELANK